MFSKTFKRCVASLLLGITVVGAVCPATVYAAGSWGNSSNSATWTDSAVPISLSGYECKQVKVQDLFPENTEGIIYTIVNTDNSAEDYVTYFNYGSLEADIYKPSPSDFNPDNFANNIMPKISNDSYSDWDSFIASMTSNISSSQGAATGGDISNLNQRFAVHYAYRVLRRKVTGDTRNMYAPNWKTRTEASAEYLDILDTTLASGTDSSLSELLQTIGITSSASDSGDYSSTGKIQSDDFVYSTKYMGILACGTTQHNSHETYDITVNDDLYLTNSFAAISCIKEYALFHKNELVDIYETDNWESDTEVKAKLSLAKTFAETYGSTVPVIRMIYEQKNSNAGNESIKSMCEKCSIADDVTTSDVNMDDLGKNTYEAYESDETPLDVFYLPKGEVGITSYDRDIILADIEVDTTQDEVLEEELIYQDKINTFTQSDSFEVSNMTNASLVEVIKTLQSKEDPEEYCKYFFSNKCDELRYILQDATLMGVEETYIIEAYNNEDYAFVYDLINNKSTMGHYIDLLLEAAEEDSLNMDNVKEYLQSNANVTLLNQGTEASLSSEESGVDKQGRATSLNSVMMSDNIMKGMGYSATYIPMQTNLYSLEVFKQYDEDFTDFWLKYGNMRKALYKSNSGTAAVDYYTAGGSTTGSVSVCTLRDIIEVGDKDLVLYVDSSFYNSEEAITRGNELRAQTLQIRKNTYDAFSEYAPLFNGGGIFTNDVKLTLSTISNPLLVTAVSEAVDLESNDDDDDKIKVDSDVLLDEFSDAVEESLRFNFGKFDSAKELMEYNSKLSYSLSLSTEAQYDDGVLKTGEYTTYSDTVAALMSGISDSEYVDVGDTDLPYTDDNTDTVVMSSSQIKDLMDMETTYTDTEVEKDKNQEIKNEYSKISSYTPLLSLAYVSYLYRDTSAFSLANAVELDNPVFIASDELCGIQEANQWYRNSILNYALIKNLKSNVQVDYAYVCDLDCPVYMDVFGNILTESGIVVVPAASNATLHAASYKDFNYGVGLYSVYGNDYSIPLETEGAYSVLYPYFTDDKDAGVYKLNAIKLNLNGSTVRLDLINQYDKTTQEALIGLYMKYLSSAEDSAHINWMAMVKIINEVMRGAPIESIDKESANLYQSNSRNRSGAIAAVKLEEMLNSLTGQMSNTLLCIPDFSRMDNLEYWVALLIKIMMVATCAVIIIMIYRDGVAGALGLKTFTKSISAIALTFCCIVVVPAVFQLSYYSANKLLLEKEALRILMVNEEKRQCGVEIGMTSTTTVDSTNDFSLQLDWISVPWYEQLETMLYESTLDNLQQVKLKAYRESDIYDNSDVDLYNDGVYVSTDTLFDSVSIDYNFNGTANKGLYLYANDKQQTAGFYSPYYVFLRTLTANVNEYNYWRGTSDDLYSSAEEASAAALADPNIVLESFNYTTKYQSGNRLKTVGVCKNYFTSEAFMNDDTDILRLYQIYQALPEDEEDDQRHQISAMEMYAFDRSLLYNEEDVAQFRASMWYNSYDKEHLAERVAIMDEYAREFIANNRDLLDKVSDETFIKVMALAMSIKYNQLFGVTSANALEIYNLDSTELIRLCVVKPEEAVYSTPMSYSRFIYNFGGEAGVYVGAVLSLIMWVGSFIKPLCTVIVFLSTFLSIFVFRVCLRRPSANLFGYLVTMGLLCVTNFLHAVILKLGVMLPSFGLPALGCLIFLCVGQVAYLLFLSYVTGVSLKDWSNLGATEYEKEARILKSKFKREDVNAKLNGNVKHHDNNWEYYNDLVKQHRQRNKN